VMVTKEQALPGRDKPLQVTNSHYILNNPIQPPFTGNLESCVFGTGCFWGTEKGFWRLPGVYTTAVGYAGGFTNNPTYEEVCTGLTGHNEVVLVVFDPSNISYGDILKQFWMSHDPTQGMGQGNDRGSQYRSGIYVNSEEQRLVAEASKQAYQKNLQSKNYGPITTEIVGPPAPTFFYAEDYHQQYLAKPGSRPYCSAQPSGIPLTDAAEWVPNIPNREKYFLRLPDEFWKKHGPKPGCTINFPDDQVQWFGSLL